MMGGTTADNHWDKVLMIIKIVFIGVLFVSLALYFWPSSTDDSSENVSQKTSEVSVEKDDATGSNTTDKKMSAIAQAERNQANYTDLREDAQQFGILLKTKQRDEYSLIKSRLLSNDKLMASFNAAKVNDISIFLYDEFYVGSGWIWINVNASDQEIIDFLVGTE